MGPPWGPRQTDDIREEWGLQDQSPCHYEGHRMWSPGLGVRSDLARNPLETGWQSWCEGSVAH